MSVCVCVCVCVCVSECASKYIIVHDLSQSLPTSPFPIPPLFTRPSPPCPNRMMSVYVLSCWNFACDALSTSLNLATSPECTAATLRRVESKGGGVEEGKRGGGGEEGRGGGKGEGRLESKGGEERESGGEKGRGGEGRRERSDGDTLYTYINTS